MFGLGTIINMGAILLGGIVGRLMGKAIPKRFQDILYMVCGVSTLFIGIGGCMQHMLVVESGMLNTQGTMMMLLSLTIGAVIGEWINLEQKLEKFGDWLKRKTGNSGDTSFIDAFVTASMGKGCIFSFIPVGLLQGSVTALSVFLKPIMTEAALSNLSYVGSILIFCVGLNLVWGKKVKVANMLPAVIIAVVWAFFG